MTETRDPTPVGPEPSGTYRRGGTLRLLLTAAAWIALGFLVALLLGAGGSFGPLLLRTGFGIEGIPTPSPLANLLTVAFGFQGTMLAAAMRYRQRGIGLRPIRRWSLVVALCGGLLVWLAVLITLTATFPALRAFAKSSSLEVLAQLSGSGPAVLLAAVVLVSVLAPVSEELFFRGWLWEALRRRGHGLAAIAVMTTLPWLLLHGIDSPGRVLFLIPAAMALVAARVLGESVRASLVVHVTNNTAAVVVEVIAHLLG